MSPVNLNWELLAAPLKGLSFKKPQAFTPWPSQPHKVRMRSGAREGPHLPLPAHLGPDWSPGAPPLRELSGVVMGAFKCDPARPSHALGGGTL